MLTPPGTRAALDVTASNPSAWHRDLDKATSPGLLAVRNDINQVRVMIGSGNTADARALLEDVISRLESYERAAAPRGDAHGQLLAAVAQAVFGQVLDAEGQEEEAHDAFSRAVSGFRSLPRALSMSGFRSDFGIALDAVGEDATAVLEEAIDVGEGTPEACRRLGAILRRRGDVSAAERVLRESLELAPGDIRTLADLAEMLVEEHRTEEATTAFHDIGWRLGAIGRLEEALAAFDRALALHPSNIDARFGKGETLRLLGRPEAAIAILDGVLDVDPDNVWGLASKGAALVSAGSYQEALQLLDRAVELDATYVFALTSRAEALYLLGRSQPALADLDTVAAMDPGQRRVWFLLGTIRFELEDLPGALEAFERALSLDSQDAEALMGKTQALLGLRRYHEAAETARAAAALHPSPALARALEGEALRLDNKLTQALEVLDQTIEVAPDFAWALGTRGQVLAALQRHEEAVADFRKATELAPAVSWVHYALGESLYQLDRNDEAIIALDRALELVPGEPATLLAKGAALVGLESYDEALAVLDAALEAEPANGYGLVLRATALASVDRFEEAETAYRSAASASPTSPAPVSGLASLLLVLGRHREALEAVDQAVALAPDNAFSLALQGRILRELGRYEEAVAALEAAASRANAPDWVLAELTEGLRLLRRYDEAIATADRALAAEPDNTAVLTSKAEVLFMLDRDDEALLVLEEALSIDDTNSFGLRVRGKIHAWNNRPQLALDSYEAAIQLKPDDAIALVAKGSILTEVKRYREALAQFDQVLDLDPGNVDAQFGKAEALRLTSSFDEAEEILDDVLAARSDDVRVVRSLGYVFVGQKRYEEAEEAFRRANDLSPNTAIALADLALVNRLLERHDVGLETAEKAVQLLPDSWSFAVYADLLIDVGRYVEALEVLERSLALDERSVDGWIRKGWALQQVGGRSEHAREAYEAALAIDEADIFARKGRADSRRELGDPDARKDYELALEVAQKTQGNDPLVQAVAGWCHYGLGRYDEAVELFLNVLASSPDLVSVQFDLALAMLSRGHAGPAMREYERAVDQLRSKHPLHQRGLVAVAQRDLERERIANDDLSNEDHPLRTITILLADAGTDAGIGG